jgi:predicted flap endonuclease-1-like 5' DNA nuclease
LIFQDSCRLVRALRIGFLSRRQLIPRTQAHGFGIASERHMADSDQDLTLGVRHTLPISKLRGVPPTVRLRLKSQRITTCAQLLLAAGVAEARAALLETTGIEANVLERLVQRADMARIKGIGTVFGLMLEELGINDVEQLARQKPAELHAALRVYNLAERLARRSPTMEEVVEWIDAAQSLPVVVTYDESNAPLVN